MKNKGFTLVEMLAVIVLIALLAGIAVGTYTRVNESAKKKTLETKIAEIKTAAEKWARENNITSKTSLSVNALVVEGYITADENKVDHIAVIKNPVNGKNMVCNIVEIEFDKGEMITKFNDQEENCTLAVQSLVDTNISVKVIDAANIDRSGNTSSSISAWTNKDVMIIASSTRYDSRATSISFDFEGQTKTYEKSGKTAYTGSTYLTKAQAASYYNVFHIDASLLLDSKVVVTYNIPNETNKSRAYTIRIDKEEATATIKANSEWVSEDKPVNIMVDDGKGSGPRYFYVTNNAIFNSSMKFAANYKGTSTQLEAGKYYIWTEDNAGNRSSTYKAIVEINNIDKTIPTCEVVFDGHHDAGNAWYKEVPVNIGAKNSEPAGISGINFGVSKTANSPVYTGFAAYNTINTVFTDKRLTNTTKAGINYYCYAKTIAGITATGTSNLKLDMTPPTVEISPKQDRSYSKSKSAVVTVRDTLSGVPRTFTIKYGWSKSLSTPPENWSTNFSAGPLVQEKRITTLLSPRVTGIYYLWVDVSGVTDVAGNHATGVNGQSGISKFGPFMLDNTPPVCDGVGGKTNWTKGTYTVNQKCRDDDGTTDQSGCAQASYSKSYSNKESLKTDTITISDKAGNKTDCTVNVYLDNTAPYCARTNDKYSWTKGSYTAKVWCGDDHSECAQSIYEHEYGTDISASGVTLEIFDKVGNKNTCTVNINLDNTNPTCQAVKVSETIGSTNGVDVKVNVTDLHSGPKLLNVSYPINDPGLKGDKTYTVYDNVDLSGTCSISIESYKCNCKYRDGACIKYGTAPCNGYTSYYSYTYNGVGLGPYECYSATTKEGAEQGCSTCASHACYSSSQVGYDICGNFSCSASCSSYGTAPCLEYEQIEYDCQTCYR